MKRELFIKEIDEYLDILTLQIEKEGDYFYFNEPYTAKEWAYHDILDYKNNDYDNWNTEDFINFIKYLRGLTGLTSKIKECNNNE